MTNKKFSIFHFPFSIQKGFTLIEILVVVTMIGILSAGTLALVNPTDQIRKARDATRKADLASLQKPLQAYFQDNGIFPVSTADYKIQDKLGVTIQWGDSWPQYMPRVPKDPLSPQQEYGYESTDGKSYRLFARLERQSDPQSIVSGDWNTAQFNFSLTSSNIAAAPFAGPTLPPTPTQGPSPTSTPTPTPTNTHTPTITPIPTSTLTPSSTSTYTITANVYVDTNGNGIQDGGELGYAGGATVARSGGGTGVTNASGQYVFSSVVGGTYSISLNYPDGYSNTTITSVAATVSPNATVNFGIKAGGPVVTTVQADYIKHNGANLNWIVNPNGYATSAWFRYDTIHPGSCNNTFGTATSLGTLAAGSTDINGGKVITSSLTPSTTYYFCAMASNSTGTTYGSILSFTTLPPKPSFASVAASSVTGTTATLESIVNPNGYATSAWYKYVQGPPGPTGCSFVDLYGTATSPVNVGAGTIDVANSVNISGLSASTLYSFCAIASNSYGTTYSLSSFTTLGPTVDTDPAHGMTSNIAVLNSRVNPNGYATSVRYRYDTTNPGSCNNTFGTVTSPVDVGAGTSTVVNTKGISGLSASTMYYFCAVASNTDSIVYGAILSFTTTAQPSVTNLAASSITDTTATLNSTINPNGYATNALYAYYPSYQNGCSTLGFLTSAVALGSGISPISNPVSISGLYPNTTYSFCAIASNSIGTTYGSEPINSPTVLTFTTNPGSSGSKTFTYTAAPETFIVPANVRSITVDIKGAEGGAAYYNGLKGVTGQGGRVQATIPVTPGETLTILLGGHGGDASSGTGGDGGFNGGSSGGANSSDGQAGGGGGGASDIRQGGSTLSNRVVVAGGGGGAGSCSGIGRSGGAGGGITGGGNDSSVCGNAITPGGGTQTAGGQGGSYSGYCSGADGSLGNGGLGCSPSGGGGGGAGYYGGGGGSWMGGGGGSGYTASGATGVTHTQGYQYGNGQVIISW